LVRLAVSNALFALGCGLAAGCFVTLAMWCFAIPPLLSATTFAVAREKDSA
jgi:hypothetical protein